MKKILYILLFLVVGFANAQRTGGEMLLVSQTQFDNESTPIDLPSLLVKLTPNSIDATATVEDDDVDIWTDESGNGNHATNSGVTSPQLHIEAGERQVEFTGSDFLTFGSGATDLDFTPGTDSFTIIVKIGHFITSTGTSQSIVHKTQLNLGASGQYAIGAESNSIRYFAGGTQSFGGDWFLDDVIAMRVNTTELDSFLNNVADIVDGGVGTVTTSNDVLIGSRYLGANDNLIGSLSYVLIYNEFLSDQELTDIYNFIK